MTETLIKSGGGGGALTGVACDQNEVERFRRWAGGEEFIDEAAADSKPDTAERLWRYSASIVLENSN